MSMGYGANYADVIEWKDIRKICPDAARKFQAVFKKFGLDLGTALQSVAQECYMGDAPEGKTEEDALEEIGQAFEVRVHSSGGCLLARWRTSGAAGKGWFMMCMADGHSRGQSGG